MIFVINKLKYDTDKMELVSDKVRVKMFFTSDVKLWKSKKGNWLLTYKVDNVHKGEMLTEEQAIDRLLKYDYDAYEKIFGELEEA